MRYLKTYEKFDTKSRLKYSDRDVTNFYLTINAWTPYTEYHEDSYLEIDKKFDLTWDHIGWILEDFIEKCDLQYSCSVGNKSEKGYSDEIEINFYPKDFETKGHSINFRNYMGRFTTFRNPKKNDLLLCVLNRIEEKLDTHFSWLTIKSENHYVDSPSLNDFNISINSSSITLIIKTKTK